VEYVDTGDVSYAASDLAVVTNEGRVLLADVSFELPQRSLLAVMGPSGAGKSILLDALTGSAPPAPALCDMTTATFTTTRRYV
jgi:ABC-type hemin transport system ATPase subunit